MKPEIAICNIFDQDAKRLVEFAVLHGFSGIDWLDPSLPELVKPAEILRTRDLLQSFLDYRYPSPVKAKPVHQQSMAAA